jgi:hypothetical protein
MLARPVTPIAELPASIPHPPALPDGTWCAVRLDTASAEDLGPSAFEVVMWFPRALELGPSEHGTVTMSHEAVQALVPGRFIDAEISGEVCPAAAFEGHGYFGARAIRVGDGMLVAVRVGG